jgi:hypothetical protein
MATKKLATATKAPLRPQARVNHWDMTVVFPDPIKA